MKRDFLKDLGIEDKATIDKILDENSKDIGRAKSEIDELEAKNADLTAQLASKTKEYDDLKESTKDYGSLNETINQLNLDKAQLTADNAQLKVDLDTKVQEIQKTHAIENGVRDAKAKNVKAVVAQLDMDKISFKDGQLSGLAEQLDALTKGEDTSFLFGETHSGSPAGTQPNNPPSNGGNGGTPPTGKTLGEAIAAKFNSNK